LSRLYSTELDKRHAGGFHLKPFSLSSVFSRKYIGDFDASRNFILSVTGLQAISNAVELGMQLRK